MISACGSGRGSEIFSASAGDSVTCSAEDSSREFQVFLRIPIINREASSRVIAIVIFYIIIDYREEKISSTIEIYLGRTRLSHSFLDINLASVSSSS